MINKIEERWKKRTTAYDKFKCYRFRNKKNWKKQAKMKITYSKDDIINLKNLNKIKYEKQYEKYERESKQ